MSRALLVHCNGWRDVSLKTCDTRHHIWQLRSLNESLSSHVDERAR